MTWSRERMTTESYNYGAVEHLHRYGILKSLLNEHMDVLDVACGEGYGTHLIAGSVRSVTGVDISEDSIEHASSKYQEENITFLLSDVLTLPLDSGSFDFVVSFETIEHLEDQASMLEQIKRVLRPGGQLLISTPDKRYYNEDQPNEFHAKELDFDDFDALLRGVFEHVRYIHQKIVRGSLIHGTDCHGTLGEFSGDFNSLEYNDTLSGSEFIIAIASDSEVDSVDLGTSLFDYSSLYRNEIKEFRRIKKAYNTIMHSRRFKIYNRILRLFGRDF